MGPIRNWWNDTVYFWWKRSYFWKSWYWFKCRFIKPYNVVKIPTLHPEWSDIDERILHVNFTLLGMYMDLENPAQINWEDGPERSFAWKEIQYLYYWWKTERPKREKMEEVFNARLDEMNWHLKTEPIGNGLSRLIPPTPEVKKEFDKWHELEARWENEDEENLIRLMKVRLYLWV